MKINFILSITKRFFFTLLKNILSLIAKIKKQNRVNILYFCELSSKYYRLFLTKFLANSKSEMSFLIGDTRNLFGKEFNIIILFFHILKLFFLNNFGTYGMA